MHESATKHVPNTARLDDRSVAGDSVDMSSSGEFSVLLEEKRDVQIVGFRVFGGLNYHAIHSANFSLEPAGKRGSATSLRLSVLPSDLQRLRGSGRPPKFGTLELQEHFAATEVFLFRWSPQLQISYATRVVLGIECLQLCRWSEPQQIVGETIEWTINQNVLDLDGELVQSFRTTAVPNEQRGREVVACFAEQWRQKEQVKGFLSASKECELVARFKACRDLFPKTVGFLEEAEQARGEQRREFMACAQKAIMTESLIFSELPCEVEHFAPDERRRYRRAKRQLERRNDPRDRKIADLWPFLQTLTSFELHKALETNELTAGVSAKSLRRRLQRLGLHSSIKPGPVPREGHESATVDPQTPEGFPDCSLESFPEPYVVKLK